MQNPYRFNIFTKTAGQRYNNIFTKCAGQLKFQNKKKDSLTTTLLHILPLFKAGIYYQRLFSKLMPPGALTISSFWSTT